VSCYLLDVNLLIALLDPSHIHHERAHAWFEAHGSASWATCPITENGVLRILGHARYPTTPGNPAAAAAFVRALRALPGHAFWPDDISLLDPQYMDTSRLLDSSQVTDSYLLALAVGRGGKLATMDRRLIPDAVVGGKQALCHV
jgi:toxin-antitoxin system PIN domain toxin